MNIKKYFDTLQEQVMESYAFAEEARKKGLDPVNSVEIPIATTLSEKATGLIASVYPQIADKRIVGRILELEKQYGSLDPAVALTIAEEIAKEKYCKFENLLQAIEAGARLAIAYLTLGVVSSPIEGFVSLHIGKRKDGKEYFMPYYSGPIRSAGGTEAGFSVVIIDYLRKMFGYEKYDPSEDEIKRGVHESQMYHERVTNLQYYPTEQEREHLMKHIPVQIAGDPSEDIEVYNYKDLERIETNLIRSGFCLVLNEGLALKAPKILKRVKKLKEKGFDVDDWLWLEEFVEVQTKIKEGKTEGADAGAVYIKDLVAGRPVFSHPSASGGFRLRYGRSRGTGYSCLAVHPATMRACGDFIAIGTQLKIEKPTKGCTVASCTDIAGPIVKFKDGSVKGLEDEEEAGRMYKDIVEIIYLGDLLIPYGDYMNRNHALDKPGYIEQYWLEELKEKGGEGELKIDFEKALELSEKFGVSLHPDFIYYWKEISVEQLFGLLDWIARGEIADGKLILPYGKDARERFSVGKRALELLGCEHKVTLENVVLNSKEKKSLMFNLGLGENLEEEVDRTSGKIKGKKESAFEIVNGICKFEIRDRGGTFIGARMGRPEKAKLRKLTGSPHVLFPVGEEGGRLRSFQSAIDKGFVNSDFPNYYCETCKEHNAYQRCIGCGEVCQLVKEGEKAYVEKKLDIRKYFNHAKKSTGLGLDDFPLVKGIRGTSSAQHSCEHLGKGLLRAKYNLHVNKDGTIRYDITEMPLTHFKPKEIGTSIEKLKVLGYEKDIYGKNLEDENQILEIFPHDVVLPASPDSLDENADDVFFKVGNFVDEELEKLYGLKAVCNFKTKEDVVGALLGCMAPHNCAAVLGRAIGFSKTQGFLASPYMHAAMRRDCDGDEACVMLLMDMLLNFSRKFLPAHRGGTQDAPLVLNTRIRAGEVDDMIFDVDVSKKMSLELFRAAEEEKSPYDVKMEQVKGRLGGDSEFKDLWFSYDTEDINLGPGCSSYKTLPTMDEKVDQQMVLCKKIRAVDTTDVARLIIERHFIRDTRGNLRKFSMQRFRCVGCNAKYRRVPLVGKCTKCGGKIIFTISEGSILKYMQKSLDLAKEYKVSDYLLESLELTEMYIHSIFGRETEKQENINKWFG